MAGTWISGIDDTTYNYLYELIGADLNQFFKATTITDSNGVAFHQFIGTDQDDWYAFLVDGEYEIDPEEYGVGSFWVIKSTQGTGNF